MAKKYDFDNSDSVACTVWGYGIRGRNRKEIYRDSALLKFEDSEFYTMAGYDEYLRNIYGDYMQLPPADKRASPHIIISAYHK